MSLGFFNGFKYIVFKHCPKKNQKNLGIFPFSDIDAYTSHEKSYYFSLNYQLALSSCSLNKNNILSGQIDLYTTFYDALTALIWKIVWYIKFFLNCTTVQLACKYRKRDGWVNFIHAN